MELNFIQYQYGAVGDYIFLILIVVATLVQAFAKKKKDEEAARAERQRKLNRELEEEDYEEEMREYPREESPRGSIFEQMEKMLMPELTEEAPIPEKRYEIPERKDVIIEKREEIKDIAKRYEKKREEERAKSAAGNSFITEEEFKAEMQKEYKPSLPAQPRKERVPVKAKVKMMEGFNLKKAVIYSEVLNRKYF